MTGNWDTWQGVQRIACPNSLMTCLSYLWNGDVNSTHHKTMENTLNLEASSFPLFLAFPYLKSISISENSLLLSLFLSFSWMVQIHWAFTSWRADGCCPDKGPWPELQKCTKFPVGTCHTSAVWQRVDHTTELCCCVGEVGGCGSGLTVMLCAQLFTGKYFTQPPEV